LSVESINGVSLAYQNCAFEERKSQNKNARTNESRGVTVRIDRVYRLATQVEEYIIDSTTNGI